MTQFHFNSSVGYGGRMARGLIAGNRIPWLGVDWITQAGSKYRYTLECILANAINAHRDGGADAWVIVSRRDTDYQTSPIYGDMSISALRPIMDAAVAGGYIEMRLGYTGYHEARAGRRTIYRGTQKLWDLLAANVPGYGDIPQTDARTGRSWVKSQATGKILQHSDPAVEAKLHTINTAKHAHSWTNMPMPQYHHVQIQDEAGVNHGGRIYTAAQSAAQHSRADWRINGEEVAEVDIAASHIGIMYTVAELAIPADPYGFAGAAERAWYKYAALVSINAKSPTTAVRAAAGALVGEGEEELKHSFIAAAAALGLTAGWRTVTAWREGKQISYDIISIPSKEAKAEVHSCSSEEEALTASQCGGLHDAVRQTIEVLRRHHHPISHYFGSNFGVRAMGIEGEIAIEVELAATRLGIPVLNIHDGFVTNKSNVDALQQIVQQVCLRRGFPLNTKIKQFTVSAGSPRPATPVATVSPSITAAQPATPPSAEKNPAFPWPAALSRWTTSPYPTTIDRDKVYTLNPPAYTRWDVTTTCNKVYRVSWLAPNKYDVILLRP